MGPGGLTTSHLQPHAVPMRSSRACTNGGSTTGAWPRGPVALGVVGTCRLLRSSSWLAFLFIHFNAWSARAGACVWCKYWSRSTISGGAGRPRLSKKDRSSSQVFHYTVDGGLLCILNLLLGNPSAGLSLLPLCPERVREDVGRLVGAHTKEHGHEAVTPLLHSLAEVLVHVDCSGFLLVNRLADGALWGCPQRLRPQPQGVPPPPYLSSGASDQLRDDQPAQPPGHSQCRRRRSRCRPRGLRTPSIDVLFAQQSSSRNRPPSILAQGHPLTRRRLLLVLHSSPCRLMPWHCTLTVLLRWGEQKDAAVIAEDPPQTQSHTSESIFLRSPQCPQGCLQVWLSSQPQSARWARDPAGP